MSEAFQQDVADRESAIQALREEGWSHQREGRFDRADLKWRALIELSHDDQEAALEIAAHACRKGQGVPAIVYLVRALRSGSACPAAVHVAAAAIALVLGRDDGPGIDDEDATGAETYLAAALSQSKSAILWPEARRALRNLAIASGASRDDLVLHASDAFSIYLDSQPDADELISELAGLAASESNDGPIIKAMNGVRNSPSNPEHWHLLGRDRLAKDDTELAARLACRAAALAPDSIRYRMGAARALAAAGKYDLAFMAYDGMRHLPAQSRTDSYHLEEADANQRSLLSRLILMTRKAVGENDPARAWSVFELIRDNENIHDREGIRASILRLSIDEVMRAHKAGAPETLSLARAHLRRDPESVYARQVLGQALMAAGRFREASDVWGSLTASLPDNARMYLQYAKCLERAGAGEAALAAAQQALVLDPTLESAAIIEARLSD